MEKGGLLEKISGETPQTIMIDYVKTDSVPDIAWFKLSAKYQPVLKSLVITPI